MFNEHIQRLVLCATGGKAGLSGNNFLLIRCRVRLVCMGAVLKSNRLSMRPCLEDKHQRRMPITIQTTSVSKWPEDVVVVVFFGIISLKLLKFITKSKWLKAPWSKLRSISTLFFFLYCGLVWSLFVKFWKISLNVWKTLILWMSP